MRFNEIGCDRCFVVVRCCERPKVWGHWAPSGYSDTWLIAIIASYRRICISFPFSPHWILLFSQNQFGTTKSKKIWRCCKCCKCCKCCRFVSVTVWLLQGYPCWYLLRWSSIRQPQPECGTWPCSALELGTRCLKNALQFTAVSVWPVCFSSPSLRALGQHRLIRLRVRRSEDSVRVQRFAILKERHMPLDQKGTIWPVSATGDPSLPRDCRGSEDHPNLSDWTNWLRIGSEHQPKGIYGNLGYLGPGMAEMASWVTRSHKKWQVWALLSQVATAFSSVPDEAA